MVVTLLGIEMSVNPRQSEFVTHCVSAIFDYNGRKVMA